MLGMVQFEGEEDKVLVVVTVGMNSVVVVAQAEWAVTQEGLV